MKAPIIEVVLVTCALDDGGAARLVGESGSLQNQNLSFVRSSARAILRLQPSNIRCALRIQGLALLTRLGQVYD